MTTETKFCKKCNAAVSNSMTECPYDGSALDDPKSDPLIGTTFAGKYEILSVLGKGGMSTVYKARHLLMNRLVAVKLMKEHLIEDSVAVGRFKREAEAVSALSHPNVVTVYDFGLTERDEPFLVMDCLDGRTLDQLIMNEGHLRVDRAVAIFRQICDALEHAHEKNVVHRDLKPLNVCLLKQPDGTELVKIVDFGLAKILGADGSEGRKLTRPGQICGSPLYMSPEQIQGKQLDRRSDIYSLGCLMYETLSGVPPFLADTTFETMNLHVVESVRKFNERLEIPPQVEAVIFRALEKDKDQRYQTALELKNDLPECGNKIAAQPRMKFQRSQIIAAAVGVCLLIAFVICVLANAK
jgi:serine/threonine protein kinase